MRCELCPHGCALSEGQDGLCKVRGVRDGRLTALGYGLVSSAGMDPIEKKPLYHFRPGSAIFSVGGWGCNFACAFCQNWTISQQLVARREHHAPEEIVRSGATGGSVGVAYTYNEPLVGFEFVRDCSRLARDAGLANVLVTNGFIREAPAAELLALIDALNIDIKSMEDAFYREHCRGRLEPVLAFARQAVAARCHVEITNLLIPGLNDGDERVAQLARWVARELGAGTPLHLSAYHPQYKLERPSTPVDTLVRAFHVASEHLEYVYLGNVVSAEGRDTACPGCGGMLVRRRGYSTRVVGISSGACHQCGRAADFVLG